MAMEVRVFPHYGNADVPHWHAQWVEDGDKARVDMKDCFGHATEVEAQAEAASMRAEHRAVAAGIVSEPGADEPSPPDEMPPQPPRAEPWIITVYEIESEDYARAVELPGPFRTRLDEVLTQPAYPCWQCRGPVGEVLEDREIWWSIPVLVQAPTLPVAVVCEDCQPGVPMVPKGLPVG